MGLRKVTPDVPLVEKPRALKTRKLYAHNLTETEAAREAYKLFRDMGPFRSKKKMVAQYPGQFSYSILTNWSRWHKWAQRIHHENEAKGRAANIAAEQTAVVEAAKTAKQIEISAARTVRELAALAYSDIRGAIQWTADSATVLDSTTISDEAAAAIESIDIYYDRAGNRHTKVKYHNKFPALQQMGVFQKLWGAKEEVQNTQNNFLILLDAYKTGKIIEVAKEMVAQGLLPEEG